MRAGLEAEGHSHGETVQYGSFRFLSSSVLWPAWCHTESSRQPGNWGLASTPEVSRGRPEGRHQLLQAERPVKIKKPGLEPHGPPDRPPRLRVSHQGRATGVDRRTDFLRKTKEKAAVEGDASSQVSFGGAPLPAHGLGTVSGAWKSAPGPEPWLLRRPHCAHCCPGSRGGQDWPAAAPSESPRMNGARPPGPACCARLPSGCPWSIGGVCDILCRT